MATLDLSRPALRLDALELKAALDLLRDGPGAPTQLEALTAAGVVHKGELATVPRRLLEVVGEPKLRLVVERFVAEAPVIEEAWAVESQAVWGSVADGVLELTALEPGLLPWQVMRVVGLGPRGRVEAPHMVSAAAEGLDGAWRTLIHEGQAAARQSLEDLDDQVRDRLLAILVEMRSSWRASSLWTGSDGEPREVTVTVVDGGRMGYWERLSREGGEVVDLRALTPGAVWRRLSTLVPSAGA